jgi:hypothetical protein
MSDEEKKPATLPTAFAQDSAEMLTGKVQNPNPKPENNQQNTDNTTNSTDSKTAE